MFYTRRLFFIISGVAHNKNKIFIKLKILEGNSNIS